MTADRHPVIANQIDAEFGRFLAALPQAPQVIDCLDADRPFDVPTEAEILVTRNIPGWKQAPAHLDLPALKWVQTFSAGVEVYPDWLKKDRIVSCGRGLTAPQIAEYVMAAMLLMVKDLAGAVVHGPSDWGPRNLGTLEGGSVGIIGYGAIGSEIARRALAFGMEVRACRRGPWDSPEEGVIACASPQEVAQASDHIVLAAPLTPETEGMVNEAFLAGAKRGCHIINIARGGLVDDAALLAALGDGTVARATLDVTTPEPLTDGHPYYGHPNVLLTPHQSFRGGSERARFERKMAFNLAAYLSGNPMRDVVDLVRGY
ncbi:NAD(P)-dependent oxidoreductase [Thioclava sp. GXIMD2076]|uniref:NAD(P)-dependent oxidoreductase n=1 Tax=unclassified Thioclava TaxID=2621713 RepID=UPI0030CCAEAB